jgi:hypothetical protein
MVIIMNSTTILVTFFSFSPLSHSCSLDLIVVLISGLNYYLIIISQIIMVSKLLIKFIVMVMLVVTISLTQLATAIIEVMLKCSVISLVRVITIVAIIE